MKQRKKIGEILLEEGILTEDQIKDILVDIRKTGQKFGEYLVDKSIIEEDILLNLLSRQLKVERYNYNSYDPDILLKKIIPFSFSHEKLICPVKRRANLLFVAMLDPLDIDTLNKIEKISNMEVEPLICSRNELIELMGTVYIPENEEDLIDKNEDHTQNDNDNVVNLDKYLSAYRIPDAKDIREYSRSFWAAMSNTLSDLKKGGGLIASQGLTNLNKWIEDYETNHPELKATRERMLHEDAAIHDKTSLDNAAKDASVINPDLSKPQEDHIFQKPTAQKLEEWKGKEFCDLLKTCIPMRFQNMDPIGFEEFIAELFRDKGYEAEVTKSTSDYGADVIARKDNRKTAIQVKRYDINNIVGVQSVNQVIAARIHYDCHNCMVITTSSFSNNAKILTEKNPLELWDYDTLIHDINRLYFDGLDIYEFFKDSPLMDRDGILKNEQEPLEFKIVDASYMPMHKVDNPTEEFEGLRIEIEVFNRLFKKTYFLLRIEDPPIIIDTLGTQHYFDSTWHDSWNEGYIYPISKVILKPCWNKNNISDMNRIREVIIKYSFGDSKLELSDIREAFLTFSQDSIKKIEVKEELLPKQKPPCFVATIAFGSSLAQEVEFLRDIRDKKLAKAHYGQVFLHYYNMFGPKMALYISDKEKLKDLTRHLIRIFIKVIRIHFTKELN